MSGWTTENEGMSGSETEGRAASSAAIAFREYEGQQIRERADGYFCLTDIAKAAGKLFPHWRELDSTDAYLKALSPVIGIPITGLIQIQQGGTPTQQGSWGHPRVAMHVALWASPALQVAVTGWMLEKLEAAAAAAQRCRVYIDDQIRLYHSGASARDAARLHQFMVAVLVREHGVKVGEEAGRQFINAADAWIVPRAAKYAADLVGCLPRVPPASDAPLATTRCPDYQSLPPAIPVFNAKVMEGGRRRAVEFISAAGGEVKVGDLSEAKPHWGVGFREAVIRSLKADGLLEERVLRHGGRGRPARILKLVEPAVSP